jgi:hypothetical protein
LGPEARIELAHVLCFEDFIGHRRCSHGVVAVAFKLDELVTTRYTLEEVNEGYQDLRDGKNIRGAIVYGNG